MFYIDWLLSNISFVFLLSLIMLSLSLILLIFDNPIYSIFYLVLVFFCSSFILIVLNMTFLGLMILIVYLGALVVLFLFVVMMLNIKTLELYRTINFFPFVFILLATIVLFFFGSSFEYFQMLEIGFFSSPISFFFMDWALIYRHISPFVVLAATLYGYEFLYLVLIGLILLLAMLGAIILTLSVERTFIRQIASKQLSRSRGIVHLFS